MPFLNTIVVAPDSFKGSLTATEACNCIKHAVHECLPNATCFLLPLADGGEGTAQILTKALNGSLVLSECLDPLNRKIKASYGLLPKGIAVIELAEASGLTRLTSDERNPLITTTYGTGLQIADALNHGAKQIVLTIGGSATNDGGMGIMSALGIKFLDEMGSILSPCGENLLKISKIDTTQLHPRVKDCTFTLLCDVDNPLFGEKGAAKVFAAQKGATPEMVYLLDQGLEHYGCLLDEMVHFEVSREPGSGAAGGVGVACMAFLNAQMNLGIDYVLSQLQFETQIANADLIVTGEGSIDRQSLHGKTIYGVWQSAKTYGIKVIAFGGVVKEDLKLDGLTCIGITPPEMSIDQAMNKEQALSNLHNAVKAYFKDYK